jgi:adenosylhomocysteine nucleosidase
MDETRCKIAIVAALEREIMPLVARWKNGRLEHAGRTYRFFAKDDVVLTCGGIGAEAARRATEAIITLYRPAVIYSVGFAGALQPNLKVGDIVAPSRVLDARDGSSTDLGEGDGILVTVSSIVSAKEKAQLAASYGAVAADMEAAAVARGAQARGIRFSAVKVISDELAFVMPPMGPFIGGHAEFNTARFVLFAALRPWLWASLAKLAGNTRRSARALGRHLETMTGPSIPEAEFSREGASR